MSFTLGHILIVGNGFDLQHGLPTKYMDFYQILNNQDEFFKAVERKGKGPTSSDHVINRIPGPINISKIEEIRGLLKDNCWAKYFLSLKAENIGWVDFEKELKPVLRMFSYCFENAKLNKKISPDAITIQFENDLYNRIAMSWVSKFWDFAIGQYLIRKEYTNPVLLIDKEKIIDELVHDWRDFVSAFSIYISEIVNKMNISTYTNIRSINPGAIINFNYTNTPETYFPKRKHYYIHGQADKPNGSIVMGVDGVSEWADKEFLPFLKYYQRLINYKDDSYHELLGKDRFSMVSIFGHSLDETDEDVLKEFVMNCRTLNIYHKEKKDFENKVQKLIAILGREEMEKRSYNAEINYFDVSQFEESISNEP